MLKKLIGVAVVAALFACSDDGGDDNKPGTSSGGGTEPGTSSPSASLECNTDNGRKLIDMGTGSATQVGGGYAFIYAKPDAFTAQLVQNAKDNCYTCPANDPSGCTAGEEVCDLNGKCGGRIDGNACFFLKEYDLSIDTGNEVASIGIGADINDNGAKIGEYKHLSYKFKGPSHSFRLAIDGENGIFWQIVQDASFDEWKEVSIKIGKIDEDGDFEAGTPELESEGFDITKITSVQWVPNGDLDPTGTLYVSNLNGCK